MTCRLRNRLFSHGIEETLGETSRSWFYAHTTISKHMHVPHICEPLLFQVLCTCVLVICPEYIWIWLHCMCSQQITLMRRAAARAAKEVSLPFDQLLDES